MLDLEAPARPRVALVFGAAGSADHLRDAVSDHVEIVYEASAADFDVSRVAAARATAALVNLDDCESLDAVETRLQEAGVTVVFNDPEISSRLDGWAQARWLRHLTAKLSGSNDFDPPRPVVVQSVPALAETGSGPGSVARVPADLASEAPASAGDAPQLVERPLSPAEIESMTADFSAVPAPPPSSASSDETAVALPPVADADSTGSSAPDTAEAGSGMEAGTPASAAAGDAMDTAIAVPGPQGEDGDGDALDIDTEALSAMIDARLAAAQGEPVPESPEVWRVLEGGSVSAVELPRIEPEPVAGAPADAPLPAASIDDSDVLKALPSLDDWQLVDPEAPAAPAAGSKPDERSVSGISMDFAGLELVPVEHATQIASHSEPIERWMQVGNDKGGAGGNAKPEAEGSKGEQA